MSLGGKLAPRDLNVLHQARLGLLGLRVPVLIGVSSISSQAVMTPVGYDALGAPGINAFVVRW